MDFITTHQGLNQRKNPLIDGGYYLVNPLNPSYKKFRGERVILRKNEIDDKDNPYITLRIDSEWHMKHQEYSTNIDIGHLELITATPPLEVLETIKLYQK